MSANAVFPGLSDLLAWPTDHLTEGAEYWEAVARQWYEAFTQVWQDSLLVDWEGKAAEALHARTYADKLKVGGLVDELQQAATVARSGASDLYAARSAMRYAVEDARAAGFEVGERLSVTDRSTGGTAAMRAVRQTQAEVFATDIRWHAAQLVAVDQQVAGRITAALVGVGNVGFGELPLSAAPTKPPPRPKRTGIQVVDDHRQQDSPPPNGPPAPDDPHLIYCYPSARPDYWWCEGYEVGKGPYAFDAPFDVSGVA
jgi:hypothetical protein